MGKNGPDYSNIATGGQVDITHPMHASQHQKGGSDEINVEALSGELADEQLSSWAKVSGKPSTFTPSAHKTNHQNGGADEISVAGLSGELADDQPPKPHASDHVEDAVDEIDAATLASGAATDGHVLTAGGDGSAAWEAATGVAMYNAYVCVRDKKAQNTHGGGFVSGAWRTRDINDEQADISAICSIASNQITLAAGTYRCLIRVPGWHVDQHQARLYNITDSVVILLGTTCNSWISGSSGAISVIVGLFTLAAQKTLEVQHQCKTTRANDGFGSRANFADEIYTVAEFWRGA